MITGWNNGSGEALAAPYTEDSDYIGSTIEFEDIYIWKRTSINSQCNFFGYIVFPQWYYDSFSIAIVQ
jgi:hypothetical protein